MILPHRIKGEFRVHILSSSTPLIEKLGALLRIEGFEVGLSRDFSEVNPDIEPLTPSVIVIDSAQGDETIAGHVRRLKSVCRGVAVFVILSDASIDVAIASLRAGASDVFTVPLNQEQFLRTINQTLSRDLRVSNMEGGIGRIERGGFQQLTSREREVLELLASGLSNKAVGQRLGISHRTVEVHRARIIS